MRGGGDLEWFLVRMMLRAYAWALAIGVAVALLVGLPIYLFHVPGRVIADVISSMFR
jgi:hypothetical protein